MEEGWVRYEGRIRYQRIALTLWPDGSSFPSPPRPRRATVNGDVLYGCNLPGVVAVFGDSTTTYTLDVPEDLVVGWSWSGATCGVVNGSDGSTFIWSHGNDFDDCRHTEENHPEASIQLVIAGDGWEATCTYRGAASGSGFACKTGWRRALERRDFALFAHGQPSRRVQGGQARPAAEATSAARPRSSCAG